MSLSIFLFHLSYQGIQTGKENRDLLRAPSERRKFGVSHPILHTTLTMVGSFLKNQTVCCVKASPPLPEQHGNLTQTVFYKCLSVSGVWNLELLFP